MFNLHVVCVLLGNTNRLGKIEFNTWLYCCFHDGQAGEMNGPSNTSVVSTGA
jgi:hypothetical protein